MGQRPTQALVPPDLRGTRNNQIQLLNYLLGFGQPGSGAGQPGASMGADSMAASGINLFNKTGQRLGGGVGQSNAFLSGAANPLDRLQSFFGNLGSPQTDLQRQSVSGISQFLNQPAPEQRALDISLPGLQEILQGGGPQFERDLSLANQQGGRFGSANAILRGEALRNLYNQRESAAQTLGMLSSAAGQNPFQRLAGAFGVGQQQAGQQDIETQRRLQLLMSLLGVGQQTAFNVPITQGSSFLDTLGQLGGLAAQLIPGGGARATAPRGPLDVPGQS